MSPDQLHALPDDQLCAVALAMCDDGVTGDLEQAECIRCGNDFEYQRTGSRKQTICPDCKDDHRRARQRASYHNCKGAPSDGKRGKPAPVVQCRGINLNYRYGAIYLREVVMQDVNRGLADMLDFVTV